MSHLPSVQYCVKLYKSLLFLSLSITEIVQYPHILKSKGYAAFDFQAQLLVNRYTTHPTQLVMAETSYYRPLSPALANVSDEPPSKRAKWSRESQRKSDESGESYDGPIVHTTDYTANTFETDGDYQVSAIQEISSNKFEAWKSCQREATSLVAEYPIHFDSVGTLSARIEEGTALFPMLLIFVPSTQEKEKWRPLLVSIAQMLHAQDCLDLEISIRVPDPRLELKQYSVERNDPLVKLWPRMREPIQRIIGKSPWNTLGVLRIGENRVSSVTTIVIGTDNVTEPSWPEIESEIKLFCRILVLVASKQKSTSRRVISWQTVTQTPAASPDSGFTVVECRWDNPSVWTRCLLELLAGM